MKCFYHSDMDGKCAGAIVRKAMMNQEDDGTGFSYHRINYNDDFPKAAGFQCKKLPFMES